MRSLWMAMLVAAAATSARSGVFIDWVTSSEGDGGRIFDERGTGNDDYRLPVGAVVQLIFTTDLSISALNPSAPFAPTGDNEEVILQDTFYSVGRISIKDIEIDNSYAGGYVFTRAFNVDVTWYYQSVLSAPLVARSSDPLDPLKNIHDPTPGGADVFTNLQVPEPGSGVLILAGLAAFFARRLRRQV